MNDFPLPEDGYDEFWFRDFAVYLGYDPSPIQKHWKWKDFLKEYGQCDAFLEKLKKYFSKNECLEVILDIVNYYSEDCYEWAENIIEKSENCRRGNLAFYMVYYFGSSRRWAENIISKMEDGYSAYKLVCFCNSQREWAEQIISKQKNSWAAAWMVWLRGSSRKWAEDIILFDGNEIVAKTMVSRSGSSQEWYEKVKRKSEEIL